MMDRIKLLDVWSDYTVVNARFFDCLTGEECEQFFSICEKAQKRYKKIWKRKDKTQ